MKETLLVSLLCIFSLPLLSQSNRIENVQYEEYPETNLSLSHTSSASPFNLPFRSLQVYDYRNDTVINGFNRNDEMAKYETGFTELMKEIMNIKAGYYKFTKGTSNACHHYLNSMIQYDITSSYTLVMIIRKLWLSSDIENKSIADGDERKQEPFLPGIKTTFEFYGYKDGIYLPLKRFDTTITHTKRLTKVAAEITELALTASVKSLLRLNIQQKLSGGKQLSYPVLQTVNLKKGVYVSFEEFKNNSPSIKNFEWRKHKKGDMLFVKDENGTEFPVRKIWGFSDGKNIYIKSADVYFGLLPYENNFYAMAAKYFSKKNQITVSQILNPFLTDNMTMYNTARMKLQLYPMQLDLDNGELY
jgi:hypothetical protein